MTVDIRIERIFVILINLPIRITFFIDYPKY